jgi:hypothetical protein
VVGSNIFHDQRVRHLRGVGLWHWATCAGPQVAVRAPEPSSAPCCARARPRGPGDPRKSAARDSGWTGRKHRRSLVQTVFGIPWPVKPFTTCSIDGKELSRRIRIENRHEAIFNAVEVYAQALRKYLREEEVRPQLWFAVVPEEVFRYGRPKSVVPKELREKSNAVLGKKGAKSILKHGSMFVEEMEAAAIYEYELNFHNQLKARLLDTGEVIQVVRETTLTPEDFEEGVRRSLQHPASVAWNLSTTSFYKSGGRPWWIAEIRDGVCYVGLVFKRIDSAKDTNNACCGAQMFLSTGEGVVFKGAVGPWYSETDDSNHLSKDKAELEFPQPNVRPFQPLSRIHQSP